MLRKSTPDLRDRVRDDAEARFFAAKMDETGQFVYACSVRKLSCFTRKASRTRSSSFLGLSVETADASVRVDMPPLLSPLSLLSNRIIQILSAFNCRFL